MQKITDLLKIIALTLFICSCGSSKYASVSSIQGDTAVLKAKQGIYLTHSKNLKLGQKIRLRPTPDSTKANCYLINPLNFKP